MTTVPNNRGITNSIIVLPDNTNGLLGAGVIRYNNTTNKTEISNNGSSFAEIGAGTTSTIAAGTNISISSGSGTNTINVVNGPTFTGTVTTSNALLRLNNSYDGVMPTIERPNAGSIAIMNPSGAVKFSGTQIQADSIDSSTGVSSIGISKSLTISGNTGTSSLSVTGLASLGIGTDTTNNVMTVLGKSLIRSNVYSNNVTLNDPQQVLDLTRYGQPGFCFDQIFRTSLSRHTNASTNAHSRVDFYLSKTTNTDLVNVFRMYDTGVVYIPGTLGIGNLPSYPLDVTGEMRTSSNLITPKITATSSSISLVPNNNAATNTTFTMSNSNLVSTASIDFQPWSNGSNYISFNGTGVHQWRARINNVNGTSFMSADNSTGVTFDYMVVGSLAMNTAGGLRTNSGNLQYYSGGAWNTLLYNGMSPSFSSLVVTGNSGASVSQAINNTNTAGYTTLTMGGDSGAGYLEILKGNSSKSGSPYTSSIINTKGMISIRGYSNDGLQSSSMNFAGDGIYPNAALKTNVSGVGNADCIILGSQGCTINYLVLGTSATLNTGSLRTNNGPEYYTGAAWKPMTSSCAMFTVSGGGIADLSMGPGVVSVARANAGISVYFTTEYDYPALNISVQVSARPDTVSHSFGIWPQRISAGIYSLTPTTNGLSYENGWNDVCTGDNYVTLRVQAV